MATKTLTISIPREDEEFLLNNPELSPSKIFQTKIKEIRNQRKDFEHLIKVKDNIIRQMGAFINDKKLWNEFQEWKNK